MHQDNLAADISLYDYLNRAAGKVLGLTIRKLAVEHKQPRSTRYVNQGGYSGEVNLYTSEFLDKCFRDPNNKRIIEEDRILYYKRKAERESNVR